MDFQNGVFFVFGIILGILVSFLFSKRQSSQTSDSFFETKLANHAIRIEELNRIVIDLMKRTQNIKT